MFRHEVNENVVISCKNETFHNMFVSFPLSQCPVEPMKGSIGMRLRKEALMLFSLIFV